MKTTIIQILLFCLSINFCQAQSNQIILQLEEGESIQQLSTSNKIKTYRQLSKSLNIWLIETSATQTNLKKETTLSDFKEQGQIKTAQFNEKVELRNTLPNDTWFVKQWQYNNKGENLGITDADIDALKAWQQTTRGLTTNGDEIVVAIIDGGIDLNHPDLINNLWTNTHEIPNNQIDDDHNGYIDDINGWNFNDTIADVGNAGYGHWHGTPVAGIIGAEGNNYEGVCGINWQVKIMNLVANQTVADVIAAYDYILEMRKRYNKTNGAEGAFIVATNASLGINEGKPADHPLWCAMYNALGEAGILNVAATANNLINVDERGDLPTTCSSNFLISVTNTNNRDELDFAAFGKQHIDLSAPGTGVFTVSNNSNYGVFGGTSAAAPHVAGAIALMYSTTNKGLMKIVQTDPSQAALLLKDCILKGTNPIADLYHKSVSNGRLNLYNSLCELEHYFEGNNCFEAEAINLQIEEVQLNTSDKAIQIKFKLQGQTYLKLRLIDTSGRIIYQEHRSNINTGKHQLALNTNNLKTGVYHVLLNTKKSSLSHTIIVYN